MEPIISVIIPVYSVERYLQHCIDSLINQTMQRIEFIFVNDASLDNSLLILKENEAKYPDRIRVIDSKVNLRQGGARNLGVDAAHGEYIGFVDSDDFVSPTMYEKLYNRIMETDADAVFIQYASISHDTVYSDTIGKSGDGGMKPLIEWNQKLLMVEGKELDKHSISDLIAYEVGGVYCGLYKKSLLMENDIRFPEKIAFEDNYWFSILEAYIRCFAFVKDIGYYYRKNPTSTTNSKNEAYFKNDRLMIEEMILQEAKKRGIYDLYFQAYEYGYIFRRTFNTYNVAVFSFDKIDYAFIAGLMKGLKKQFPNWKKNPYYLEANGKKERLKKSLIVKMPRLMAAYFRIKYR